MIKACFKTHQRKAMPLCVTVWICVDVCCDVFLWWAMQSQMCNTLSDFNLQSTHIGFSTSSPVPHFVDILKHLFDSVLWYCLKDVHDLGDVWLRDADSEGLHIQDAFKWHLPHSAAMANITQEASASSSVSVLRQQGNPHEPTRRETPENLHTTKKTPELTTHLCVVHDDDRNTAMENGILQTSWPAITWHGQAELWPASTQQTFKTWSTTLKMAKSIHRISNRLHKVKQSVPRWGAVLWRLVALLAPYLDRSVLYSSLGNVSALSP